MTPCHTTGHAGPNPPAYRSSGFCVEGEGRSFRDMDSLAESLGSDVDLMVLNMAPPDI